MAGMQDPIILEDVELRTFTPRRGRENREGDEVEPPKVALVFTVDADHVQGYMNRLTRIFRHKWRIKKLIIEAVEQSVLFKAKEPAEQTKLGEAAEKNGTSTASPTSGTKKVETGKKDAKKKKRPTPV